MNVIRDALTTQEELEKAARLEQIRRQGHSFIEVRYSGPMQYPNPRLKQVYDIVLYQEANPDTGVMEYHTREGTAELMFEPNAIGDRTTQVYDCDYNRQFIANHLSMGLSVADRAISAEIEALVGKSYKVEVSREESLLRKRRAIDKELSRIRGTEDEVEETTPRAADQTRKAGRPRKKRNVVMATKPERAPEDRGPYRAPVQKKRSVSKTMMPPRAPEEDPPTFTEVTVTPEPATAGE